MKELDLYAKIEPFLEFEEEVAYLHNRFKSIVSKKDIKTLIDIGCGQGAFCKLLKDDIKTFGVDLSEKQIEFAKQNGIDAKVIDIKDIKEKFDCATAVFDVVNYLPNDYIEEFFQHTFNLLNKNGYFIFDINSYFGFDEVAQGTLCIDKDERFIAIDALFDDDILETKLTMFEKFQECYKKDSATIKQYYYENSYLKSILENIGFKVENIEEFTLHNFDEADKYIFVCKKI